MNQKKQKDAEKEDKKASTAYKKNLKDEIKTFMKDSDTEQLVALVGFIRTL